ncbi:MAG: DUF1211 domain-containing protein [Armatimonadetes bacterium]|nr:DUF1211 domain-containing protein [Armatimonadota bacterium]MDE2206558.1 DUF1211 domain-containing protein [Armatimonadota bacterium]
MKRPADPTREGTERIQAFSDGVFAIAITLLILDIHVPTLPANAPPHALARALVNQWPAYGAYIFTFVMIGIYWANHHYIFRLYVRTNHAFNLLNVLFLMCICFLPYPTAVVAQYFAAPSQQSAAVTLYAIGLLLPAATWLLCWLYATSRRRLIDKRLTQGFIRQMTVQFCASCAVYAVAIAVTQVSPGAGIAIALGLTLIYLLPPRPPEYAGSTVDAGAGRPS